MAKPGITKDKLLQVAFDLIWDSSYGSVSVGDICDRAGVNKGSFYHFFESKEALLRAVLEGYIHGLRPIIVNPAFEKTDEPLERIFAILAGYRERILQTNCQYGCPLGRLALEIDPENRPAHRLIADNFSGWIGAVRECILQMKSRLPKKTDVDALATYVLVVMEGGVMLSRSYGSVEPIDRAVAQLREHFRMLLGSKSSRRPR